MFAKPGIVQQPSLTLKRRLNAAPEKVYAAWTEPSQIVQWFGPTGAEVLSAEMDVRVDGRFRVIFTTPDGENHNVSGTYLEVVPARKLVFTWMWITLPDRQSQVTVSLKPDGDGCMLTLTHEKFFDEAARDGHNRGWSGSLDKLEAYFA